MATKAKKKVVKKAYIPNGKTRGRIMDVNHGHRNGYTEASKAFGGCTKCYGKGYSTQQHGVRLQIHTCVCERGKQLDGILLAVQEGNASIIV